MRRCLIHGVIAGLTGGAAFALLLLLLGEGPIGDAVALEHEGSGGHTDAVFGRGAQQVGGALGGLLFGAALGALFAVAFVLLRGRNGVGAGGRRRLGADDDWRATISLAGIGFLTLYLVPFLKYPANPPAVGDPETIGQRTVLWLLILAWSVVATWAAWQAGSRLRHRGLAEHLRMPAVGGLYVVVVACGLALLPASPDDVTAPGTLLWRFRLASVAGAAACWAVMGTVFGWFQVAARRRSAAGRPGSTPSLVTSRR